MENKLKDTLQNFDERLYKINKRQKENNMLIYSLIQELQESRNNKVKGLKAVFILQIILMIAYFSLLRHSVSAGIILGVFAMTMNLRFFSYKSVGTENEKLTNKIKHWLRLDKVEPDESDGSDQEQT